MKKIIIFLGLSFFSISLFAIDIRQVSDAVKNAQAGDVILIDKGEYSDITLLLHGKGSAEKPIIIKAEVPGQVILTGHSSLRLSGEYIEVQGLVFTRGYTEKGSIIEYRNGKEVANHCRITECAILDYSKPVRTEEDVWIMMYGRNNRFDHNVVQGKTNMGCTFVVQLDEERHQKNQHRIDHNYFGKRPLLGSNGGESIRVGNSTYSLTSSLTVIENNYFEHCNGEVEVVSIKACDNSVRNNTFYECEGVVALRHGNRNTVEGNAFLGGNKAFTGGVRIVNEGHTIRNNYFENLTGERFFAALAIMNAVPNSLPNRYHQVKDVNIEGNVWNHCERLELCVGADNERSLPPSQVTIANNVIYHPQKTKVFEAFDDISGFIFRDNQATLSKGSELPNGFSRTTQKPQNIAIHAAKKDDCGPSWYDKNDEKKGNKMSYFQVKRGQNSLLKVIQEVTDGAVIELVEAGEYLIDRTLLINKTITLSTSKELAGKVILRYNGTKSRESMITLGDGAQLTVFGIWFNGQPFDGKNAPGAGIATHNAMKSTYSAHLNRCRFSHFQESSFNAFKALKGTFASELSFEDCFFHDLSGDAISLSSEKEDRGTYNAEYVYVNRCKFYNILGAALDLYRGGSDESTSGPTLSFENNILEDVNNKERGSAVRLFGVQRCRVSNCQFIHSGKGGSAIRFDEAKWDKIAVTDCNLYDSGRIFSFYGKVVTGTITNTAPTRSLKTEL